MYYVYVLKSLTVVSWTYIGCCDNLQERFARHNKGDVRSTKARRPYILVYYESYRVKGDARTREIALKTNSVQKEDLFKRIRLSLEDVSMLSS